jgi:hypothetical protein
VESFGQSKQLTQIVKMLLFLSIIRHKKNYTSNRYENGKEKKPQITQQNSRPAQEVRNPELIEKFYKQIVNNFGYAYPGKA